MKLKNQVQIIRELVAEGKIKDALAKLRQLAEGSSSINEIILQAARLSSLQTGLVTGSVTYQDQDIARNQIIAAILEILSSVEAEIKKMSSLWQVEIDNTLDEIISKHGIAPDIHETIVKHRKLAKTYFCLWIDDNPRNDKMEMQTIMSLGFECRTALSPYEAYSILKSNKPDIIIINSLSRLLDNENEGIDFCKFLEKQKQFSQIPILLHSISYQNRLKNTDKAKLWSDLPSNIQNDFEGKNVLVIRDLIEEIVRIVFTQKNIQDNDKKVLNDNSTKGQVKLSGPSISERINSKIK